MKKVTILLLLFTSTLFADVLDTLLQEYQSTAEKSLRTVNEKLGHVVIYSQKELRSMQYNKLDDILKELPLMSLGTNRFGSSSSLLVGSKSVSGFFRFFINDYEISSTHLQSPSLNWGNLPLDMVDHIEIYYGDSSFSAGNTTGIYFVRIYTKSANKENGSEIRSLLSSTGSNTQSFIQSQTFENGWSYLFFANTSKTKDDAKYKTNTLENDENRRYLYADINNETTKINIAYTDVKKDIFTGLSLDAAPDSGKIKSRDYFINLTKHLLEDKSLKINASIGVNEREYEEKNAQGMGVIPVLNFANMPATILKEFYEDATFTKTNVGLTKTFQYNNHNVLAGMHVTGKKYTLKKRTAVNLLNQASNVGKYNDFDKENVYSLLLQHDYRATDNLILIANAKIDKYARNGYLGDTTEHLLRVGAIYTPFENLGFKGFYTRTYLPVSFYNIDFVDKNNPNLKSQQYELYTAEMVYTHGKSKFNIVYNNVTIDDFIFFTPIGFINVDHPVKTQGLILNYEYAFSQADKLLLNYFTSTQSEGVSNYQRGGYVKYMGGYQKFDYFAALIYKGSFSYYDVHVKDSFDLSVGATYHFTKDFSISLKGENLLKKSTDSLYEENFGIPYALKTTPQRSAYLSLKWVF
ncbi:MAG: TonB-dependent receptor [Campylobacterales bacterium]|nr:TonB-dependent receptor [Campylobacterales bacterium]